MWPTLGRLCAGEIKMSNKHALRPQRSHSPVRDRHISWNLRIQNSTQHRVGAWKTQSGFRSQGGQAKISPRIWSWVGAWLDVEGWAGMHTPPLRCCTRATCVMWSRPSVLMCSLPGQWWANIQGNAWIGKHVNPISAQRQPLVCGKDQEWQRTTAGGDFFFFPTSFSPFSNPSC